MWLQEPLKQNKHLEISSNLHNIFKDSEIFSDTIS